MVLLLHCRGHTRKGLGTPGRAQPGRSGRELVVPAQAWLSGSKNSRSISGKPRPQLRFHPVQVIEQARGMVRLPHARLQREHALTLPVCNVSM